MNFILGTMSILIESTLAGLKEQSATTPHKWAEDVRLHLPFSARSPHFRCDTSPWLNPIFEGIADNRNKVVVVRACTGGGKTTIYDVMVPYIVAEDPGPTQLTFQDDDEAKSYAEERLSVVIKNCSALEGLMPKDRNKVRKTEIMWPHMAMRLAGANLGSLQSKSLRWVFGDEVWLWKPGMVAEYEKRDHDRWNSRLVLVSQGAEEGSEFSNKWAETDGRVWSWVCPECGLVQPYDFRQLKYEKVLIGSSEQIDYDATGESARMCCANVQAEKCEFAFGDDRRVRKQLSEAGVYVPTLQGRDQRIGFHFNALGVYWIDFKKIVAEWVMASERRKLGDSTKHWAFIMKRLAEDKEEADMTDRPEVVLSNYSKETYLAGNKIDDEFIRVLAADKQLNHYWISIRAWRRDGSSRLLYEGKALTREAIREKQDAYKVENKLVFVDAQYDTFETYRMCAQEEWTAIHGSKERHFVHPVRAAGRARREHKLFSRLQLASVSSKLKARYLFFAADRVKDVLFELRQGKGPKWEHPSDTSKEYFRQLDSEEKREVIDKTTKQISKRWVKVKRDNHQWDTETIHTTVALVFGILGGVDMTSGQE